MPFFIPATTTCAICEKSIKKRIDALVLTYADPADVGKLAMLSRSYVHRGCWETWEHRNAYAESSRKLNLRPGPTSDQLVMERNGVFLYDRETQLDIEDVYVACELELSVGDDDALELAEGLLARLPSATNLSPRRIAALETPTAHVEQSDQGLIITLLDKGEPRWRFVIPPERQMAWAVAVGRAGEILAG